MLLACESIHDLLMSNSDQWSHNPIYCDVTYLVFSYNSSTFSTVLLSSLQTPHISFSAVYISCLLSSISMHKVIYLSIILLPSLHRRGTKPTYSFMGLRITLHTCIWLLICMWLLILYQWVHGLDILIISPPHVSIRPLIITHLLCQLGWFKLMKNSVVLASYKQMHIIMLTAVKCSQSV